MRVVVKIDILIDELLAAIEAWLKHHKPPKPPHHKDKVHKFDFTVCQ